MNYLASFSGYSVDDTHAAKDFYVGILGLRLFDESMGLGFELPGGGRLFLYEKLDHVPATFTVLNFVVDDIDQAVTDLKANGVQFESYEGEMIGTDEHNIARGKVSGDGPDIAWFKDPAGNILSVLEE